MADSSSTPVPMNVSTPTTASGSSSSGSNDPQLGTHYIFSNIYNTSLSDAQWVHYRSVIQDNSELFVNEPIILAYLKLIEANVPCIWIKSYKQQQQQQQQQLQLQQQRKMGITSSPSPPLYSLKSNAKVVTSSIKSPTTPPSSTPILKGTTSTANANANATATNGNILTPTSPLLSANSPPGSSSHIQQQQILTDNMISAAETAPFSLDTVNNDSIDLWVFPISAPELAKMATSTSEAADTPTSTSTSTTTFDIDSISELQSITKIDSGKWDTSEINQNPVITNLFYKSLFNLIEHQLVQTNNFVRVGNSFIRKNSIDKKTVKKDPYFESLRQLNSDDISELSFSFSFFLSNRSLMFHLFVERKRIQSIANLAKLEYMKSPIITSPNCYFGYQKLSQQQLQQQNLSNGNGVNENNNQFENVNGNVNGANTTGSDPNFTLTSNQWKQLFNINLRTSLGNTNVNHHHSVSNNSGIPTKSIQYLSISNSPASPSPSPSTSSASATSAQSSNSSHYLDRPKQLELFGISNRHGMYFPTELLYRYIPYTSDHTAKFYHDKLRELGLENEDQSVLAYIERGLSLFGRSNRQYLLQLQNGSSNTSSIDYWNYQIPFIFPKDQQQTQPQQADQQHHSNKQMFSPSSNLNSPFPSSPSQNQANTSAMQSPFSNSPKSPATSPMTSPDEQPSPADSLDPTKKRSSKSASQKKGRTTKRKKDDDSSEPSTSAANTNTTTAATTTIAAGKPPLPPQQQADAKQPPQQQAVAPQQQQPQQQQQAPPLQQQHSFSSMDLFGSDSLGDPFKKDDDLMHLSDTDIDLDTWTNHYPEQQQQKQNSLLSTNNSNINSAMQSVPNIADSFLPNNANQMKNQPANKPLADQQIHQPQQPQQQLQPQQPMALNDLNSNQQQSNTNDHLHLNANTAQHNQQSAPVNPTTQPLTSQPTQLISTTTTTANVNSNPGATAASSVMAIDHTKSPINPAYLVPYKAPSLSQANIPTMPDIVPELFGSGGSGSHHLFHNDARDINGSGSDASSSNSLLLSGGNNTSQKTLSNLQYTPEGTSSASLAQYLQQLTQYNDRSLRSSLDDSVDGLTSVYSTLAVSKLGEQQVANANYLKSKSSYYCPPSYKPIDESSLPFQTNKLEYNYVPLSKSSTAPLIKYTPTMSTQQSAGSASTLSASSSALNKQVTSSGSLSHSQVQLQQQNNQMQFQLRKSQTSVSSGITINSNLPNSPIFSSPISPVLSDREDAAIDNQQSGALFTFDNVLSPVTNSYIQQSLTRPQIVHQPFSYEKIMSAEECQEFANFIQQMATSNYDINQGYSVDNSPLTKLTVEMLMEEWVKSLVSTDGNLYSPALQYHALTEEVTSESVYAALNPMSKPVLLNLTARSLFGFSSILSKIFKNEDMDTNSPLSLSDTEVFSGVEWLPTPRLMVGYKEEWMEAPSTIIRHWDKALIEPYSPKKNITYYVLCPDTQVMRIHIPAFFSDVSNIYEINHLGHHQHFTTTLTVTTTINPPNSNNQFQNKHHHPQQQQQTTTTTSINNTTNSGLFPQGIYYIPTLASTAAPNPQNQQAGGVDPNQLLISSYLTACSKLSDHLKEISLQYNENNCIVVYIVNPFTESSQFGGNTNNTSANAESESVFQRQRESLMFINSCFRAIMKETYLNESLNIMVQPIPIEQIFYDDSQTIPIAKEIAFSIFNKCRRISTLSPILNGAPSVNNYTNWCQKFADKIFEPIFVLSQPKLLQNSNVYQPNNIHISYMLSDNNRWVACTITDDRGEMLESKLVPAVMSEYTGELLWRDTLASVWIFIYETINLVLLSNGITARAVISKFGLISKEEYEEWQRLFANIPDRNPLEHVLFTNFTMHPYLQLFSSEFFNDTFSKSQDTLILPAFSLKGQSYAVYPKSPFIYNYHLNNPLPLVSSFVVTSHSNSPVLAHQQTNFESKKEWPVVYMISIIGEQSVKSQTINIDQPTIPDLSESIKQITKIYNRLSYLNISPRYPDRYSILPIHHTITKRMSRLAGFAAPKSPKPLQPFHQLKTPVSNWSAKSPLSNNPTSPTTISRDSSATGSPITAIKDDPMPS